jgi:hypothetical protein
MLRGVFSSVEIAASAVVVVRCCRCLSVIDWYVLMTEEEVRM